ncbi:hypothetical protein D9611_003443 [Ephemerocybe angulata]|uniref:GH16 domain-containing protein n=1 Tax=Ephemerocybe angulata TaxID=980116 RepID=A0A8H5C8I8_9AGAR|nr:hypothetical protein D9611_003443 [Tulosesus angulatus]
MRLLNSAPLCLLLLVLQITTETSATQSHAPRRTLPRLVKRAHDSAVRKTHSLARDLRVAFNGVLPRAEVLENNRAGRPVVYCKAGSQQVLQPPNNDGDDGKGNEGSGAGEGSGGNSTSGAGTTTTRSTTRVNTSNPPTSTRTTTRSTSSSSTQASSATSQPTSTPRPESPWKLVNNYQGNTFFQGWDFFTGDDPTHGIVDFLDEGAARSNGLAETNSAGNAIMRVETTPTVSGNRKSVRITTQAQFNGGLVLLDAVHMPVGCGTWPAFWTNGPNWPNGGEIDILEGVHDYERNQATLHTSTGCTLLSTDQNTLAISGTVVAGTNCDATATSNQGCGIRASSAASYGKGFNQNGGGVYAMKWDATGIAIYFFPRGSIPDDIAANAPTPESWATMPSSTRHCVETGQEVFGTLVAFPAKRKVVPSGPASRPVKSLSEREARQCKKHTGKCAPFKSIRSASLYARIGHAGEVW